MAAVGRRLPKASIVIESRKGDAGGRELDLLLYRGALEVVPVDQDQAEIARAAWRRFGTGRHPAALNFGDCFAYALAMSRQVPLLFCGAGFARTDVAAVLGNNGKTRMNADEATSTPWIFGLRRFCISKCGFKIRPKSAWPWTASISSGQGVR